jgi:hypothetical protein
MMRSSFMAVVALCVLAAPACKKKEAEKEVAVAPAEPTPPPAAEPTPPPAEPPPADDMINKMKNCPNAVAGAETKVAPDKKKKFLTVSIVAKDEAATTEIRSRAHKLLDAAAAPAGEIKHTGERTGGGALGKCPVIVDGATAKVKDVKGGVEVALTPVAPKTLDEVATGVNERVTNMPKDGEAAGGAAAAGGDGAAAAGGDADKAAAGDADMAAGDKSAVGSGAAATSGKGAGKAAAEDKAEGGQ